jgi:hypothetical protein
MRTRMATRRAQPKDGGLGPMVDETAALVDRLLSEHRTLKAQNEKLAREVERLSRGWDEVRRLAGSVPRRRTSTGRAR